MTDYIAFLGTVKLMIDPYKVGAFVLAVILIRYLFRRFSR